MTDVAGALHLLMQRLELTERQWQAEKERADEAERGEREAWRQTDEVRRERDEARAEVERLSVEKQSTIKALDQHWLVKFASETARAEKAETERDEARAIHREREEKWQRDWDARTARMEKAEAEVEHLRAALDAERDWSRALGEDSRSQQKQLDAVCDAVGFYPRNDATDVAGLVRAALAASQAREKRLREALREVLEENEQRAVVSRDSPAEDAARAVLAEEHP